MTTLPAAPSPDALPPAPAPVDPHGFGFVRAPLDKPWTWEYVSSKLPGRVMLCVWPAEEESAGEHGKKIVLPKRAQKRLHSIAWVVGCSPDCRQVVSEQSHLTVTAPPLFPGDTVLVPQYVLEQGLSVPGEGNEDLAIVDAENIIMAYRADAQTEEPQEEPTP